MLAQGQIGTNLLLINLAWKLDFRPLEEWDSGAVSQREKWKPKKLCKEAWGACSSKGRVNEISDAISFYFMHVDAMDSLTQQYRQEDKRQ